MIIANRWKFHLQRIDDLALPLEGEKNARSPIVHHNSGIYPHENPVPGPFSKSSIFDYRIFFFKIASSFLDK